MKAMNLKGIICLVIIFLSANQVCAAEWIFLESIPTGVQYYNKSSIKELNKNIFCVWTKETYNENGKIRNYSFLKKIGKAPDNPYILSHELKLLEIDCENKKIKVSSNNFYDKQGNVITSAPQTYCERIDIVPESIAETLKNIVCNADKTSKKK
jgi:hypothetical protein